MHWNNQPAKGTLLISKPLIGDGFFEQSVVYLTEHNDEGTLGFTLNKESNLFVKDLIDDFERDNALMFGGPVEQDALFYLHEEERIPNSAPVGNGLFLGGDFEVFQKLIQEDQKTTFKAFLGYSGWSPGQLEDEISDGTWVVLHPPFETDILTLSKDAWRDYMHTLGGEYRIWANAPEDPWMN